MKIGDLVSHDPACFDPGRGWVNGIIVESRDEQDRDLLTQHRIYWSPQTSCWTEEGLLKVISEV